MILKQANVLEPLDWGAEEDTTPRVHPLLMGLLQPSPLDDRNHLAKHHAEEKAFSREASEQLEKRKFATHTALDSPAK